MSLAAKKGCNHSSSTLVQAVHEDEEIGRFWFCAFQCDHCGSLIQKPVSYEEIVTANDAPWLDMDSYESATMERAEQELEFAALSFMAKACQPAYTNGNGRHK